MKHPRLSEAGGDRATGYAMSNKIVALDSGYLCTWIDCQRRNQWGLVDRDCRRILRQGALGEPCVDNHCGAVLALADGNVHAITGGHHSAFRHLRTNPSMAGEWEHVATIDGRGTYPSLASDAQGRLHLAFRTSGERWSLSYSRFEKGGWTPVQSLVVAEKPGYIYWTNGLALGPDGALHLVFGNTRVRPDGALFLGASHLLSRDGGRSWHAADGVALCPPAPVSAVPLMVDERSPERLQSPAHQQEHLVPGPRNANYQQIHLSNPVVDPHGTVHAILHNGLNGTADLMSCRGGKWQARPLADLATGGDRACRVHLQSSLTLGPEGQLLAALMVEPTDECVWGPPGTHTVCLTMKSDGSPAEILPVTRPDPSCAQWLPAFEQRSGMAPDHTPPLLYTKGTNAGGFDHNRNALATEVYLCLP